MRKLLPTLAAALLMTPLVAGSVHAATYGLRGPGGRPSAAAPAPGGGGPGGGGFVGRPGGPGGGFAGRPGGGGFVGGRPGWGGHPSSWGHDRWRGGFRGSVVFVDPWYDPFWPYGYGFGWGWGWYGPPYYGERRVVSEYAPQPEPEDYGPPPEQYWYYCSNPDGYYPYVQSCNDAWQPVPVNPPTNAPGPRSGPSANSSQSEDRPDAGG